MSNIIYVIIKVFKYFKFVFVYLFIFSIIFDVKLFGLIIRKYDLMYIWNIV